MDNYLMFGILLVVVVCIIVGVYYLKTKTKNKQLISLILNYIDIADDVALEIVKHLNLKNEKNIIDILKIIDETIKFIEENNKDNDVNLFDISCNYVYDIMSKMNIEVTEQRKYIIKNILEIILKNKGLISEF